jgi:hypothetical protein
MTEAQLRWQNPEWQKKAGDWIKGETARLGVQITGEIAQPHIYPWSSVLHVPTNEGMLFFKATAAETIYEAALTQKLAGWYPDRMPELVAVDAAQGWMLMRDGGEPLRTAIRATQDVKHWTPVIALYAELQIGVVKYVPDLLALGVPDWRLARLPGLYVDLLSDTDALRLEQEDGLSAEEFQRVKDLTARFAGICSELAGIGIPETINHGDFHDGNVLVRDGRVTLFDWGDGNITHPFVTLRTFFVSIENSLKLDDYAFTPEMQDLLLVYLEPWQRFASKEALLSAYSLSRCVATVVKTLAWHQTVSRLEEGPQREKYAGIVPELFREFIFLEKMLSS